MPAAVDAVSDVVPPLAIYPRWSPSLAPPALQPTAARLRPSAESEHGKPEPVPVPLGLAGRG